MAISKRNRSEAPLGRKELWAIIAIFALALLLRMAFNVPAAQDDGTGAYLYSGNDPWYHEKTVDSMLENGETVRYDPVTNYPEGRVNPNPPFYDWMATKTVKMFDMAGVDNALSYGLNFEVAFWGALGVIPVFLFARHLFGFGAGIFAGGLLAVNPAHIERSAFGFADHDATTMFWLSLTFYFMLRSLSAVNHKSTAQGKQLLLENRQAVLWSGLAGVALAAGALTWKGYPYAVGILAIAFTLQLFIDNLRHRDGALVGLLYTIPLVVSLIVAAPYYFLFNLEGSTIVPHLYALLGMAAVAAVLLATKSLPNVVVIPSFFLAAVLGLLVSLFVIPQIGELLFTGLGYFQTSKLYSTIAEAQRTPLGYVAASFGFFSFVLAFWTLGKAIGQSFKGSQTMVLLASWGLVAMFMAFAASRFVMNAAPVFAILMGAAMMWCLAFANLGSVRRTFSQRSGQSVVPRALASLNPRAFLVTLGVVGLLVLPNLWVGVDAATSFEYENEHELNSHFFGAYGLSFAVKNNGWLEALQALGEENQDLPIEERPAFLAWWDYGHWATSIAKHPAVADPFQGHYELAGRFLAAESEDAGFAWLNILLIDGQLRTDGISDATRAAVTRAGGDMAAYTGSYDDKFEALSGVEDQQDLYEALMDTTGKKVGYLGVDVRMYPISQQSSGIFYAPVFLANKNPDEFLQTTFSGQGIRLTLEQYDYDEEGNSYRLDKPRFLDASGNEWYVTQGLAFASEQEAITNPNAGIAVTPSFQPTAKFVNSMYNRAFGSPSIEQAIPGEGLTHWVLKHQSIGAGFRQVAILEYDPGATLSGQVSGSGGNLDGIQVVAVDQFGAGHGRATTDANGNYELTVPHGDITIEFRSGGQVLASEDITVADGVEDAGTLNKMLADGSVTGLTFRDFNGNGVYDNATDELVGGVQLTLDGVTVTSGNDGVYNFAGVSPGGYTITIGGADFVAGSSSVVVKPEETATQNVAVRRNAVEVTVTLTDNGENLENIAFTLTGPDQRNLSTGVDGTAEVQIQPGTYRIQVDVENTAEGTSYELDQTFTVTGAGGDFTFEL